MQLITCAASVLLATAAVPADEIKTMPGWEGKLPAKIYSGLMDSTPTGEALPQHMHYMFFECEVDPATAPVLIWSNGGPGAGSEFGLFTELGPLMLTDESLQTAAYNKTGVPSLFYNPYAWTKVANVLMYDSPPPVGFSYCGTNVTGDGYSCGDWDDYRTAKAAHTFVENWYVTLPVGRDNLFLSVGTRPTPSTASTICSCRASPTPGCTFRCSRARSSTTRTPSRGRS